MTEHFPNTPLAFTKLSPAELIGLDAAIKRTARWYPDSASVEYHS